MFRTTCPDCKGRKGRNAITCVKCMFIRRHEAHRKNVLGEKE